MTFTQAEAVRDCIGVARDRRRRRGAGQAEGRGRPDDADLAVLDGLQQATSSTRPKAQGIDLLEPFNSEFDTAKQITGVQERHHPRRQGHHLLALRLRRRRHRAEDRRRRPASRSWPSTWPRPSGPVAIVVRANNVAYGEKACQYIGEHVTGGQGRADHGRPGLDQRPRPRQRLPRLRHQELPEPEAAGDPDQGLGAPTTPPPGSTPC